MGWIISQALYEKWHCSQELEEESSEDICLDGKQSAPLSGNPIQLAYLSQDKMTKFSRLSRFGMTFKPLTADRGEDLLMWYREGFLARTLVQRGGGQELTELGQACGVKWHELSVKYDLGSCSWRTHQCLWDEELPWSSVTLPRWGMIANGVLFQHPIAERPINGTGSGLWATPTTMDHLLCESKKMQAEVAAGRRQKSSNLRDQVSNMNQWPTPQASDNRDRGNLGSPATLRRKEKGKQISLGQSVSDISGALNPPWVEWLMGWPLGWTDLRQLGMDRFLVWQQQHSLYCEGDK
jgi:hypothetical protein